jgi:hypothetical protein
MNLHKPLFWFLHLVLYVIAITTLVSGVVQMVAPSFILGLISAEITTATKQCFGTIGMFMALFGGLLLHTLITRQMPSAVYLWAGLQKVGAFIAVGIGVFHQVFGPKALIVAGFDLLCGILIFVYMKVATSAARAPLPEVERTVP